MKLFSLRKGYIGVETNKPRAVKVLQEEADKISPEKIQIISLAAKYPQGSEKQIVKAVTGRSIPPGKLPPDVGAIVINASTCAAVYRSVHNGIPCIDRIVTVGGECVSQPANVRVRIGTPIEYIFEKTGGFRSEPAKIVMGGPMMGTAVSSFNIPVIKGTSGIITFGLKSAVLPKSRTCLRCGKCVGGCPMGLLPNMLDLASAKNDIDSMNKLNITDCIECGSCSFNCPSKRYLVQSIKTGKERVRQTGKEPLKD